MIRRFWWTAGCLAAVALGGVALAASGTSTSGGALTENEMIFRSSTLSDLPVYNRDNPNVKLGSLDNLIIDARTGHVCYGILSTGMIGGKLIPVPWMAVLLNKTVGKDKYWLTLNKTKDELASARPSTRRSGRTSPIRSGSSQ